MIQAHNRQAVSGRVEQRQRRQRDQRGERGRAGAGGARAARRQVARRVERGRVAAHAGGRLQERAQAQ